MFTEFKVHLMNDKGIVKMKEMAEHYNYLMHNIDGLIPDGRYKAIVKTKLEEACFFSKKGIASDESNQLPPKSS